MEETTSPQNSVNEEVTYPFKAGLDPRDQGGDSLTEGKNMYGENIVKSPGERPSTGKLSKYPYEATTKGTVRK